jgi:glycerol-3-phosphate O-acyltransferase
VIFLRGGEGGESLRLFQKVLESAEEEDERPLGLVPVPILYGAKPRTVERSFWEILFGPREKAGFLQKLFWLLVRPEEIRVILSEPVLLSEFLRERKEERGVLSRKVYLTLLIHISQTEKTYFGPTILPRKVIVETALRDPSLREFLVEYSRRKNLPFAEATLEAKRILTEISADYRWGVLRFLEFVLTRIWSRIYEDFHIDLDGLEEIQKIRKKGAVVLIPSHKSHMDYLILSYIFKLNDLMPPFIAAGINMSFFPMGYFFRRAGAFFIRRTFVGDLLYEHALRAYVKTLLREKYFVEFFIEGTRSRSGNVLPPRLGLLGMVVESAPFLHRLGSTIYLVPIAIDYEFLIEEKSIVQEALGKEKKPESFRSLIGARKTLSHRYGSVYVQFAPPISLRSVLQDGKEVDRETLRRLGYMVTKGIQSRVTITATSLLATALCMHPRRGISRDDLMERMEFLKDMARKKSARLASDFTFGKMDPDLALRWFLNKGVLREITIRGERIYSIPDEGRATLDYYKNTIIHYFLSLSFTALSFRLAGDDTFLSLWEGYRLLWEIYQEEFHRYGETILPQELEGELKLLEEYGIIRKEGDFFRVVNPGILLALENMTSNFLESKYIVVHTLLEGYHDGGRTLHGWTRLAMEMGELLYFKGDISRPESRNRVNLENALNSLRHQGFLKEIGEGRGKMLLMVDPSRMEELKKYYQFFRQILEKEETIYYG